MIGSAVAHALLLGIDYGSSFVFLCRAVSEGLKGQELGDQAVFGVNKE